MRQDAEKNAQCNRAKLSGLKATKGPVIFMSWGGGGAVVSGELSKIFELKGGPSQKLRGKGGHASICTGLRGATQDF